MADVKIYGDADGNRTVELTPLTTYGDKCDLQKQYGLILRDRPYISPPEPKYRYIDIDGADGALDYTELISHLVNYKMRTIRMTFLLANFESRWDMVYSKLLAFLQKGKMRINILPRPADYWGYWEGRVKIDEWSSDKNIGTIVLTATVDPYRVADKETSTSKMSVSGGTLEEWSIKGADKPVVPTLTVTNVSTSYGLTIQVTAGLFKTTNAYDLKNGTYKLPFVMMGSGINLVELSGQGNVVLKYLEGWL